MLSWIKNNRLISRILIVKLILAFGVVTFYPLEVDAGRVSVRGYYRKDGTYVSPHYRSAPDGTPYNNYSFPGNYNPNTGSITPGNPQTYLDRYYNRSSYNSTSYDFDKLLKDIENGYKTSSDVNVRGYFRSDGSYVAPHVRTAPDGNPYNNYSSRKTAKPTQIPPRKTYARKTAKPTQIPPRKTYARKTAKPAQIPPRKTYARKTAKPAQIPPRKTYARKTAKPAQIPSRKTYARKTAKPAQIPSLPKPGKGVGNSFFTVGSTKSEVIAVQGTPDSSTENRFSYGSSTVYFEDGRVKRWHNSFLRPLKAKTYFIVGSTKSEVIAVQGTPDSSTETHFSYGLSTVYFRDSRVTSWNSYYPNILKVK